MHYICIMRSLTIRFPISLERRLRNTARRLGVTSSAVVRRCLEDGLHKRGNGNARLTCMDLVSDLVGSQPGPRDASTDKRYLHCFGR